MPTKSSPPAIYCSWDSQQSAEPLFGTAVQATVWFLLEYPLRWGSKAFEESEISTAVKAHLKTALKSLPQARLQLIKSPISSFPKQIGFFVACTDENPSFSEWQLSNYQDLLQLDLINLAQKLSAAENSNRKQPIFLVCTNGKRDLCCARLGRPVFASLLSQCESEAWQTTHIGGHRFAGNLLCFPHGIIYGRVQPGDVSPIISSYSKGELVLGNLRGRSCYSDSTQAAEYYLRAQTGVTALAAYRHLKTEALSADQTVETFADASGSFQHALAIQKYTDRLVYTSCKDQERSPVTSYQLVDHQVSRNR